MNVFSELERCGFIPPTSSFHNDGAFSKATQDWTSMDKSDQAWEQHRKWIAEQEINVAAFYKADDYLRSSDQISKFYDPKFVKAKKRIDEWERIRLMFEEEALDAEKEAEKVKKTKRKNEKKQDKKREEKSDTKDVIETVETAEAAEDDDDIIEVVEVEC